MSKDTKLDKPKKKVDRQSRSGGTIRCIQCGTARDVSQVWNASSKWLCDECSKEKNVEEKVAAVIENVNTTDPSTPADVITDDFYNAMDKVLDEVSYVEFEFHNLSNDARTALMDAGARMGVVIEKHNPQSNLKYKSTILFVKADWQLINRITKAQTVFAIPEYTYGEVYEVLPLFVFKDHMNKPVCVYQLTDTGSGAINHDIAELRMEMTEFAQHLTEK